MATIKTAKQDIINNFSRYLGRQPNATEIAKYQSLPPTTLESDLKTQYQRITGHPYGSTTTTVNNPVAPPVVNNTPSSNNYTWTDPATGAPTPPGVGNPTPVTSNNGTNNGSDNSGGSTNGNKSGEKTQAEIDAEAEAKLDQENLDKAYAYIDGSSFDEATKVLLKQIASQQYKTDNKIYQGAEIDKIISDASLAAAGSLDPYYTKETAKSIEDLQNKLSDIRSKSESYLKSEKVTYADTLKKTKQSLMASGRTFSSSSRDTLGGQSALGSGDIKGMEGMIPEQRRLAIQKANNEALSASRDLGLSAERNLGSAKLQGLDLGSIVNPYAGGNTYNPNSNTSLYSPAGNVSTGDLELERLKEIEKAKQDRIRSLYL